MKLRYLDKQDGKPPVLQFQGECWNLWYDVETVKEPRKPAAREWWIRYPKDGSRPIVRMGVLDDIEGYHDWIHVREVTENESRA